MTDRKNEAGNSGKRDGKFMKKEAAAKGETENFMASQR
jgi:hypothetical protein